MIITLAEAKEYIGVTVDTWDTIIEAMVDAVAGQFGNHLGRHLEDTAVTEIIDGPRGRRLRLNEPARSITTIHSSGSQDWTSANLVAADRYSLAEETVHGINWIWTRGFQNIRVVYDAGFATIPEPIKMAARIQVGYMYSQWQREKGGESILRSKTVQGVREEYVEEMALRPEVVGILEPYRPARI